MSRMVATKVLRHGDLFVLPNGSIYETTRGGENAYAAQARMWCAHPPDPVTAASQLIDLLPEQQVQLLDRDETRGHSSHAGYVRAVFEHEMDRQHQARMIPVYEKMKREDAAALQRSRASRPWWKKLFA